MTPSHDRGPGPGRPPRPSRPGRHARVDAPASGPFLPQAASPRPPAHPSPAGAAGLPDRAAHAAPPVPRARALVVTSDPELLDDLLRLAAAAGCEPEVADAGGAARSSWSSAPVVLVGADAAAGCIAARLPRRPDVVLVGDDLDDAGVWRVAVELGAEHVVFRPDAEPWLVDLFADAVEQPRRGRGAVVVGVVGGRGGAGATTLAVALAVGGLRRGLRTMLVDADPLGGGIDLAVGAEDAQGLRWPDLAAARGRVPGAALTQALPCVGELAVLSWDRGESRQVPPEAMDALLGAACRGSDLVVLDLPRAPDAAAAVALGRTDVALLVVPAEVRAAAAAARVAAHVAEHCRDLRVVVRGPAPAGLGADAVAASLGLPLAASLRSEPGLAGMLERGEPPGRHVKGPLSRFVETFLAGLPALGAEHPAVATPSPGHRDAPSQRARRGGGGSGPR